MKEVWNKTQQIQVIKKRLGNDCQVVVPADKLGLALGQSKDNLK